MMGYGYDSGDGGLMWLYGGLMILGVLLLIGIAAWALISVTRRSHRDLVSMDSPVAPTGDGRARQILDERYARGELDTEEYTERLHTLGR
jgi:putative membrane protein